MQKVKIQVKNFNLLRNISTEIDEENEIIYAKSKREATKIKELDDLIEKLKKELCILSISIDRDKLKLKQKGLNKLIKFLEDSGIGYDASDNFLFIRLSNFQNQIILDNIIYGTIEEFHISYNLITLKEEEIIKELHRIIEDDKILERLKQEYNIDFYRSYDF